MSTWQHDAWQELEDLIVSRDLPLETSETISRAMQMAWDRARDHHA